MHKSPAKIQTQTQTQTQTETETESEISGFSQFTQVKYLNQPIPPINSKSQKSRAYYSTFRRPHELNQAMLNLYLTQAPELLKAIQCHFSDESENGDPEIRVGLSIKILHNTPPSTRFPMEIIKPIILDIEAMIKNTTDLKATGDARLRLRCLQKELGLVQRYIELADTVSLNSIKSKYSTTLASQIELKPENESDSVDQTTHNDQSSHATQSDPGYPGQNDKSNTTSQPGQPGQSEQPCHPSQSGQSSQSDPPTNTTQSNLDDQEDFGECALM